MVQAAEVAFAPVKENRAAEMMAGTESANESEIRIRDNGEEKGVNSREGANSQRRTNHLKEVSGRKVVNGQKRTKYP